MFGAQALSDADSSVSLTLQSLIDTRFNTTPISKINAENLGQLTGIIHSRQRGQGLEFEDLRAYTAGDDVRHIDWKVSARHNQLFTRLYREEREQLLQIAVDFSPSMFTGSEELKAVKAGRMAAQLAWQSISSGARCGLLVQTPSGFSAIRAATGDKCALAICAELASQFAQARSLVAESVVSNSVTEDKVIADENLFTQVQAMSRDAGSVVMLTGLDDIHDTFNMKLKELEAARRIAVVCIDDPLEYKALPPGTFHYKTSGTKKRIVLNDKQAQAIAEQLQQQNTQLAELFANARVPLLFSRNGIDAIKQSLVHLGFLV